MPSHKPSAGPPARGPAPPPPTLAGSSSALLAHQAARGTGLGDADAVLRLAGERRPVDTLGEILRGMGARENLIALCVHD